MNNLLDSFVRIAPYINQLTTTDYAVSVCDLEKCLIYVPSKEMDHKLKAGDAHVNDSAAYESILKKEKITKKVDSVVFGFPYIVIAIPLFDGDELVGSASLSESVERQELLVSLSDNLYDTIKQLTSVTELIFENSTKLQKISEELKESIRKLQAKTLDTNSNLNELGEIYKNINSLAINLTIESTKIGAEKDKFIEVSEQMRELADVTENETLGIEDTMKNLNNVVDEIKISILQIIDISKNQIDINKYINSISKDLNDRTERLKENAQSLAR